MKALRKYFTKYDIRYFENFPDNPEILCPICGKNDNDYCVLVGVDGTSHDNIEEALPVHLHCLMDSKMMRINSKVGVLYQRLVLSPKSEST